MGRRPWHFADPILPAAKSGQDCILAAAPLGALALSKQKAIVSKLSAIEEMAGVDILCSDKTGTLTKNELTLGVAFPSTLYRPVYAIIPSKKEAGASVSLRELSETIALNRSAVMISDPWPSA
jgi:magnesium-transporting ATPase (P-type)